MMVYWLCCIVCVLIPFQHLSKSGSGDRCADIARQCQATTNVVAHFIDSETKGSVVIRQDYKDDTIKIVSIDFSDIAEGKYSLHIHSYGDFWPDCAAAGWHYERPQDSNHPNIVFNNHFTKEFEVERDGIWNDTFIMQNSIYIHGPLSVVGRGIVLHDLSTKTKKDSGKAIACAIFGIQNPADLP